MLDRLPLYATDAELSIAILGKRSKDWTQFVLLYEHKGLPKINPLLGGRYVPAVKQFLDALEGVSGQSAPPNLRVGAEVDLSLWNVRRARRRD